MSDNTSSLGNLQKGFLTALQHPHQSVNFSSDFSISPNSRLSGAECLAIYQRSYYARLLNCMREQFPALCHCLGNSIFDEFATDYLTQCAPTSYTLYDLGRRFPDFLYETRPNQDLDDSAQEIWVNFMLDLVGFEFQVFTLFDAQGDEASWFAAADTPDDALQLQKCFVLDTFRFDVADYYHGVRNKQNPPLPPLQQTNIALVRKNFLTHTLYLTDLHYAFLLALKSGGTVVGALAEVSDRYNLPLEQVSSSWLHPEGIRQRWIKNGLFLDKRKLL